MNTEFFIAKRYLFSKRKINFITIISIISIVGVTIGVAAMIIVLSVFNGFNQKVTSILVGFDPHVRIEAKNSKYLENPDGITQTLMNNGVQNISPYILSKGMLATEEVNKVLLIKGVDEETIDKVSGIRKYTKYGSFNLEDDGDYGRIILGFALANSLKVFIHDTLTLLSPVGIEYSLTQFIEPITKKFIVTGIYDSDNRDYDSKYAYISIANAQDLFRYDNNVSGIEAKIGNIDDSEELKQKLESVLDTNSLSVMTWYDLHKDFYSILKIERWIAFIILSLIIAVASFNILGSLTMTVIEKKRDIGILKAMGATDKTIMRIFMFEGIVVGLIGMVVGSFIGFITVMAQLYFKIYKLDTSVYKIDSLPVDLRLTDFIFVPLAALLLCYLAALYPSKRAASLKPVESIRWE